jgi:hypothetical protein
VHTQGQNECKNGGKLLNENNNSIFSKEDRHKQFEFLGLSGIKTMNAEALMNTPLTSTPFVVSELIPQGLHILGGAAKIGKSWLVLWLGLMIAQGKPIWNYETKQGKVLYLALEDSYERLQRRLLDISEEGTSNLECAVECKNLSEGFCDEIDTFMQNNPETKMVIVDTFQKIRQDASSNGNLYSADYKELGVLKNLAAKHQIAILLVHHLRKQGASDPVNMLTGSTGISGAVDSTFILKRDKRTENAATLFCTGRDIKSLEIPLVFSEYSCTWVLRDENPELVMLIDPTISLVDNYFKETRTDDFCGSATELSELIKAQSGTEIKPSVLSKKLLCGHAQFCSLGYECHFYRTHESKKIEIHRIKSEEEGVDS